MAYFQIPSKRTRQPQGAVRVKSWVGASDAAICTQILARNIITGKTPTLYGVTYDPSIQVGPGGIALVTASNANQIRAPSYSGARLTNNFTLIACASKPDLAAASNLIDADAYPTTRKYQFYIGTDGKINIIPFNSSGQPSFAVSTNAASANQVFIAAMRYADTADVWLNGVGSTPVAVTGGATTATQDFTVGAGQSGSDIDDCNSGGAFIYGWVAVPRLLSDAELRVVTQHPSAFWGELFAPDTRKLYFGASGGGATTTTINAETGAFALTGAAATLNRGLVPLDAQPTSYAVSGTAATLARGWNLDAQPGTFSVSGTAATLARGWNLDAQPSTFAVSGTDATLARGWNLDAQPGAFELTGVTATLEYGQPGVYALDCQPGVFAVSGAAATLTYVQLTHYVIDAQPGTFTFTGVAGTLTYSQLNAYEITASPGTFAVTGTDATLTYTLASIWIDINPASSIWTDIDPNTIWTGL